MNDETNKKQDEKKYTNFSDFILQNVNKLCKLKFDDTELNYTEYVESKEKNSKKPFNDFRDQNAELFLGESSIAKVNLEISFFLKKKTLELLSPIELSKEVLSNFKFSLTACLSHTELKLDEINDLNRSAN